MMSRFQYVVYNVILLLYKFTPNMFPVYRFTPNKLLGSLCQWNLRLQVSIAFGLQQTLSFHHSGEKGEPKENAHCIYSINPSLVECIPTSESYTDNPELPLRLLTKW